MSDTYGFPKRRGLVDKLGAITPSRDSEVGVPMDRVDDAGARHGFTSREPEIPFRREKTVGPVVTLHTRAPIRVATPFQRFCEINRFSYWEGLEELMKRAGVHPPRPDGSA
jgi:hypothetical protein